MTMFNSRLRCLTCTYHYITQTCSCSMFFHFHQFYQVLILTSLGQAFSFNTKQLRNQISTDEGSPNDDDSYLGYSVATGEFTGDETMDVAVGMPRGANLTGKVVLYNNNLTNLHNLTGDQIGAYFGYSIATCDINGDTLDDIIIGAPMWTDFTAMGKFETGRVFVVYQDKGVS